MLIQRQSMVGSKWISRLLGVVAVGAALVAATPTVARSGSARASMLASASVPVVVELFTSEGCSDCPPADSLLKSLATTQPVPGARIIPLEEHVDYWNHGGWADPYSSPALTSRQSEYAGRIRSSEVYTPQMVVDGTAQFVGSDRDQALQAIRKAAEQRKSVALPITDVRAQGGTVSFSVGVGDVPGAGGPVDVLAALTEDDLTSNVRGGENGGRSLQHNAVVRALGVVGVGSDKAGAPGGEMRAQLPLAPDWRRGGALRLAVFAQQRGSGRIVGASEVTL